MKKINKSKLKGEILRRSRLELNLKRMTSRIDPDDLNVLFVINRHIPSVFSELGHDIDTTPHSLVDFYADLSRCYDFEYNVLKLLESYLIFIIRNNLK